MTDRHAGYVVVLEEAIREDDAEQTVAALKQIKGVLDVRPIINDPMLTAAEARVRQELMRKFYEFYLGIVRWKDN